ncbi:MAG: thioredoxin-disulfide reductase [Candidatus Hodarchaeales archaeon]
MQLFLRSKPSSDEINNQQELVIIGSGPAGLTAAIYAARAQLNPLVIAGIEAGGQLMTTTEVENFPGFPDNVQGPDLITRMREQANRLGTTFLEDNVIDVSFTQKPFLVFTGQHQIEAKAVIIATGAEPKRLGLPNEQELSGRGISYCATCDAPFFKDVDAAVIGAGDVALEEALFLVKYADNVKIIYRGPKEKMRATKALLQRGFDNDKIEFVYNTEVVNIMGKERLNGITIRDIITDQTEELHLGGLLVAIGYIPQTQLFRGKGKIALKNGYIIHAKHTMTSIPGVFAAGDVVDYRYRQAITAAAEGCQAALDAEKWLQDPENF